MTIAKTSSPVAKRDFTLRAVNVAKTFTCSSESIQNSAYTLREGLYSGRITPVSSSLADNDPVNEDGTFKHIIWKSIDQRYYRYKYDAYATPEHISSERTHKNLYSSASILSIPYYDFGSGIKPSTVAIQGGNSIDVQDDGNGNLVLSDSSSLGKFMDDSDLVAYWGFNQEFVKFIRAYGTITEGEVQLHSRAFSVDKHSDCVNIGILPGVEVDGEASGHCAYFDGNSFIHSEHRAEYNFNEGLYTISFWIKTPTNQAITTSSTNFLLGKSGVCHKQMKGKFQRPLLDGTTYEVSGLYQQFDNETTPIYPYKVEIINQTDLIDFGRIKFSISDGRRTLTLKSTTRVDDNEWHHIRIVKDKTTATLLIDGGSEDSGSIETLRFTANNKSVMIGSGDLNFTNGFSGHLDEIRIYENIDQLGTVEDPHGLSRSNLGLYQTNVVGNVNYRSGTVILSSPIPSYQQIFSSGWTATFKGTHTIYQYEVLCRIKRGEFNTPTNPTARVHPESDRLNEQFTSGSISTYATTIGLYNSNHELMAVAKLAQPVRMRDDVDINILIQWDV